MATEEFVLSISEEPVETWESRLGTDRDLGADLRFLGVVRDSENGKPIRGIDYSCYLPMAEGELRKIATALQDEHPGHRVLIHHRIGFVEAGVASIVIRVRTRHSAEAFALGQEYLRRIKATVPLWKKIIPIKGD